MFLFPHLSFLSLMGADALTPQKQPGSGPTASWAASNLLVISLGNPGPSGWGVPVSYLFLSRNLFQSSSRFCFQSFNEPHWKSKQAQEENQTVHKNPGVCYELICVPPNKLIASGLLCPMPQLASVVFGAWLECLGCLFKTTYLSPLI